jgi:hypothetical protein
VLSACPAVPNVTVVTNTQTRPDVGLESPLDGPSVVRLFREALDMIINLTTLLLFVVVNISNLFVWTLNSGDFTLSQELPKLTRNVQIENMIDQVWRLQ